MGLLGLSFHIQLSTSFDIGNGWPGLAGPGLEKDFKADYWIYTVAAQFIGLLHMQHVDK